MHLRSDDFRDMQPIPDGLAFGMPGAGGEPIVLSANRNPHFAWSDVPEHTHSFVLLCVDPDVPSVGDDVNQPGHRVAASLPRVEFVHWLLVDIPRECRELAKASCSDGVVAHGKRTPHGPPGSRQGLNDYTGWFAGDADMAGDYLGYDGPCPPWNDERLHHYHFRLYALDSASLDVPARFTLTDVRTAMRTHVLAEAAVTGTYSLNPALRR
ncbi:MAG TPA: YbhB/YbcL family Raf kinase inhibitor-like protein [Dokdonella sp.]